VNKQIKLVDVMQADVKERERKSEKMWGEVED
jgi:hypothetical protein